MTFCLQKHGTVNIVYLFKKDNCKKKKILKNNNDIKKTETKN